MAKHQVLRSAILLTMSGIIAKSADFFFRAYYSRQLGTEGMGLLSLVFGIHGIMLTVATAGLGVAVSKVVSEYIEQNKAGAAHRSMKTAVFGVVCLSLFVIAATMVCAPFLAARILGDSRTRISICCLVPSILFMGISYCIKGYFYATRRVLIPASSEILEQVVKFVVIKTLLSWWSPLGIEYACSAVFLGISIGELSSCTYLSAFYLAAYRRGRHEPGTEEKGIARALLCISVPTMLSSLIGSTLRMQEDIWIVSSFERYGMTHELAVRALGTVCGMIMPMLVFPLTLFGSMTNLLVPEIARAAAVRNRKRLYRLTAKVYGAGLAAGLAVALLFGLFARQLSQLFYGTAEIAPTVSCLAFLAPVMFMDSLSCGILNGLGQQFRMLKYNVLDSCVRLSAIWFLIPQYGSAALIGMIIFSNLFTCSLTVHRVFKVLTRLTKHDIIN